MCALHSSEDSTEDLQCPETTECDAETSLSVTGFVTVARIVSAAVAAGTADAIVN